MPERWRTHDEHPDHWPEVRCTQCNAKLLRRFYPDRGKGEDLQKFRIRRTCGDPVCVRKMKSAAKACSPSKVIPERPPFDCPVCGKTATRPPNVRKHVWWRRKTCGNNACIIALSTRRYRK